MTVPLRRLILTSGRNGRGVCMVVEMETRLGLRIATFVPADAVHDFRYPLVPCGVEPTVQRFVGGITDRASREPSTVHPKRGVVLLEARGLWSSCATPPAHEWVLEQIRPGGRRSPHEAGGLCISAMEVEPAIEYEFNEWYDEEHMPLMDALPGMLAARRFRATHGSPRYVAVYHLESPDVYKQRLWYEANQTPWLRRIHRFRLRTLHLILTRID
jgi:hypothetical protein